MAKLLEVEIGSISLGSFNKAEVKLFKRFKIFLWINIIKLDVTSS